MIQKITILIIFFLSATFVYAAAVELYTMDLYDDVDLTAYYRLENTADSEDSGTDYDLTNTNSTTFTSAKFNNGGTFNGTDQALNNISVLGVTSYPKSFVGWVKFDDVTGSEQTVFCLGDNNIHYYNFKCRSSDSHLVFRSNDNTQAADVDTGIVAVVGTWYHFVVVQHSATSVTIYIDGVKKNDEVATYSATTPYFWLGYLGRSYVWYLDGQIDDFAIFNRIITADEADKLANGILVPSIITPALPHYWDI